MGRKSTDAQISVFTVPEDMKERLARSLYQRLWGKPKCNFNQSDAMNEENERRIGHSHKAFKVAAWQQERLEMQRAHIVEISKLQKKSSTNCCANCPLQSL